MKQHVLIRFGKWREIIAQELPRDRELYCSRQADGAPRKRRTSRQACVAASSW
jgi:hypothetical protein